MIDHGPYMHGSWGMGIIYACAYCSFNEKAIMKDTDDSHSVQVI